ncbi:very-long-chain (3R)-3-hydroxyacyl-coa dehydratase [Vairimorpha necatrix]|uniref:Very-long-chain (3R)-3-hydroxyacyl-CoA dehydratase n=1 Tax=Vairimorpha necatrix TaxID=6039 RepID=A0AAX4JA07_9MICR
MKYITFYNIIGVINTLIALFTSLIYHFTRQRPFLLITAICQTFFILEILNIKLQTSNSRYLPTVIQLFFRLFNIWIVFYFYDCCNRHFYIVMSAWYLTDCIRYLYYISRNKYIKIIRYNLFIFLYPISIYIEMSSMYKGVSKIEGMFKYLYLSFLCIYIPSMIFLIRHMFRQRKWANKKIIKNE